MRAILILLIGLQFVHAQSRLGAEFHRGRREAFRAQMPKNSVAVFFAAPIRNRANDVNYHYHQNSDYFYLTGHKEPGGVLILFSENRTIYGKSTNEVLFVMDNDPKAELWTGKRLGIQKAADTLGFAVVRSNRDFFNLPIKFSTFSQILFLQPQTDIRSAVYDVSDPTNIAALQAAFLRQAEIPELISYTLLDVYSLIRKGNGAVIPQIEYLVKENPVFLSDYWVSSYTSAKKDKDRLDIAKLIPAERFDLKTPNKILDGLRQIKLPAELALLERAIRITTTAQIEAMKAIHPGMSELEIQGLHEFVYRRYGAAHEGYPSIVGSGHNGCVLHYTQNDRPKVGQDLVLMDLGAEYEGYTADVTRTVPASGRFSAEQKAIYELVLKAQTDGIAACKAGAFFFAPHHAAKATIAKGLKELGIIQKESEVERYFPHGTSHFLGLDVHDRGVTGVLQENMVITVEPGVYIPPGSPCDPKWWGIAVRIEDDVLITANGCEVLSANAPRTVEEIESLMAETSPLENWQLPEIDN